MNSNFLLETKKEYTIRLVNLLAPFIYEGFNSIYVDALKVAKEGSELKIFQNFLRRISKWNVDMINRESKRILNYSNSVDFLEDLVRAVIKANIIVLSNTSPDTSLNYLDKKQYMDIKFNDFIHKCYIESAREIFNNPYLFYHKYQAIDIKRNQRDSISLIKECIEEAIRKMLPVQHILKEYLGNNYQKPRDINVEASISEVEAANLKNLVNKDLKNNNEIKQFLSEKNIVNSPVNNSVSKKSASRLLIVGSGLPEVNNISEKKDIISDKSVKNIPLQISDNIQNKIIFDNSTNNTSEIKNLVNSKSNKFSHTKKDVYVIENKDLNDRKDVLEKLNLNTNSIKKEDIKNNQEENILKNSVYNDVSDSETSISYHVENDEYEDIFSNVNDKNDNSSIKSNKSGSNVFMKNNNSSSIKKRAYFEKYKQI